MSSTESSASGEKSGNQAASALDSQNKTLESQHVRMKRAAAKQLIEAYYFQLTDGCGNSECDNECCASSTNFKMHSNDRNALALMSVELFKQKAKLCERGPKIARLPIDQKNLSTKNLSTLSRNVSEVLPGPSTSKGSGIISKIGAAQENKEVDFLNEEKFVDILQQCQRTNNWSLLIKAIGSVYSNPDSLMKSFRLTCGNSILPEMNLAADSESGEKIHRSGMEFHSGEDIDLQTEIDVDIISLDRCYELLMDTPNLPFEDAMINAVNTLSKTINIDFQFIRKLQIAANYLNVFVIVMELPMLNSPDFIDMAFPEFCKVMGYLPLSDQIKLVKYWSQFSAIKLKNMVQSLQQLITLKLILGEEEGRWRINYLNNEESITAPVKVLNILYYASMLGGDRDPKSLLDEERENLEAENQLQHDLLGASAMGPEVKEPRLTKTKDDYFTKELDITHADCRNPLVPYEDFVNDTLNKYLDEDIDYKYKVESEWNPKRFSFANYNFVLNTASKQMSLYSDNRIQMLNELQTSTVQTFMLDMPPMPYLRIRVSRDHIIDDALVALEMVAMDNPSDFRKQLYVEFDGEQGVDEGGVSKEFFQLIIEEIFNVDFGMFTYNNETKQFWFNPMSFENDGQFTMIGIVLGLAIYNNTIVDVHFPAVVYRKLIGKKGTFQDLPDVDPCLARSLQELLDYTDDNIEDVFMQTFQISYKDIFGNTITYELMDKGESIPITQANKKEFVELYSDFILNKSIENQFRAFRRGFQMVTNESPLRTLFRPSEIELLICGSDHYDFVALEDACEYDGGFEISSPTIRYFWEVVHSLTEEQKRQLLQFTTGTYRVPVGGLSKLKLIITKNGPDSDRLPSAHTCFNVLLLPDYNNKAKLEERLLKAITYSKGFGML